MHDTWRAVKNSKENAIKNCMRGLDHETLYFVKERLPTILDEAIELGAEADLENNARNIVHEVQNRSAGKSNDATAVSYKRIAIIEVNIDVLILRNLGIISVIILR